MEQQASTSKTKMVLTGGLVLGVLALGIFGAIAFQNTTKSSNIKINVGENSIEMGFEQEGLNLSAILEALFKDETQRRETLALLREFNEVYELNGEHLIQRISIEPGNSDLSKKLRDLLVKLQGPFDRNFHDYYDVRQASVVAAIENLDYDHQVAKRIRELRNESKGPFEERIKPVRIRILSESDIAAGYAAVCADGDYYREQIHLFEPDYEKLISVSAFMARPCPRPSDNTIAAGPPVVRISRADAKRLFGDRSLSDTEAGFAQITWRPPVIVPPQEVAKSSQG